MTCTADIVILNAQMPFELNTRGAAETDSTLRVRKHSRVFALGDVAGIDASPEDGSLPATAQVTSLKSYITRQRRYNFIY